MENQKTQAAAKHTPEQFAYAVERSLIFERQRDEMVEALREVLKWQALAERDDMPISRHCFESARAAMAKAGAL